MIWRWSIEREAEKLFKRQSIIDLVFEFGVGVDAEPFLKEHAFKEEQRRIGIRALTAGPHGILSHQDLFNALPLDGVIEFIHQFEAAVVFEGACQCQVSESEGIAHLFVAHEYPPSICNIERYV